MKRFLLVVLVVVSASCAVLLHCGSDKAGLGDFCNTDSDCAGSLVCENNTCASASSGDCSPACTEEFETCFQGQCVPFGNPEDKDADGALVGEDCDDFNPEIRPGAHEYCDGLDNNCDGLTDEGCPDCQDGEIQACSTDLGECIAGLQNCTGGGWDTCSGTGPQPELCDSKDNDCDGLTDEVCPCASGDEFPCGIDEGICAVGVQTCESGLWSGCHNGELPRAELCNGLDEDCDGVTDDGFNLGAPCTGQGECGAGRIECAADLDVRCDSMPGGSNDQSSGEVCDTLDNDCDGLTDEGLEADLAPNTCVLAQELVGLPDNVEGGSRTTVVGNLWPPGDEDWYKVTAIDDVAEDLDDNCDSFHFALRFDQNPAGFLLDVYVDNCEVLDCRDDDAYNFYYDYNEILGGQPVGQCECYGLDEESSMEGFNICTSDPKTFYVRVHAGEGQVETCENYQLTFSNGIWVDVP